MAVGQHSWISPTGSGTGRCAWSPRSNRCWRSPDVPGSGRDRASPRSAGVGFRVGTCSSARRRRRQPCRRRRKCLRRGDSFIKPFSAFDKDRRSATRKATPKALPPRKLFTTHLLRSLKTFRRDHCASRPFAGQIFNARRDRKMLADPSRGDRRRPGRVHQSPLLLTPAPARQLPTCGSRCLVLRS